MQKFKITNTEIKELEKKYNDFLRTYVRGADLNSDYLAFKVEKNGPSNYVFERIRGLETVCL